MLLVSGLELRCFLLFSYLSLFLPRLGRSTSVTEILQTWHLDLGSTGMTGVVGHVKKEHKKQSVSVGLPTSYLGISQPGVGNCGSVELPAPIGTVALRLAPRTGIDLLSGCCHEEWWMRKQWVRNAPWGTCSSISGCQQPTSKLKGQSTLAWQTNVRQHAFYSPTDSYHFNLGSIDLWVLCPLDLSQHRRDKRRGLD